MLTFQRNQLSISAILASLIFLMSTPGSTATACALCCGDNLNTIDSYYIRDTVSGLYLCFDNGNITNVGGGLEYNFFDPSANNSPEYKALFTFNFQNVTDSVGRHIVNKASGLKLIYTRAYWTGDVYSPYYFLAERPTYDVTFVPIAVDPELGTLYHLHAMGNYNYERIYNMQTSFFGQVAALGGTSLQDRASRLQLVCPPTN